MDERRRLPRANLMLSVFVSVQGIQLHASTLDLSADGMSVLMFRSLPPGTQCEVELRWKTNGQFDFVYANATVLHSTPAPEGGFRMGLAFQGLDERSRVMVSVLA